MKLIVGVIRPEKLESVREALIDADVTLMYAGAVANVWRARTRLYRGVKHPSYETMLRIEIAVADNAAVPGVVEAIRHSAVEGGSGLRGSGEIWVLELEAWASIRAGSASDRSAAPAAGMSRATTQCVSHK